MPGPPGTASFPPMAWFRKDKKPRQPRAERLEIPADAWEKCEACGHTDIRDKFARNFNVCPACDYHRRFRAHEYAALLLDDGTLEEKDVELASVDPLEFPEYPGRLKKALKNAGDHDAILTLSGLMDQMPVDVEQAVAIGQLSDDVAVPQFVIEGLGHAIGLH